jgi:hypothetical protein
MRLAAALAQFVAAICIAAPASAAITSVSASGPGGTVSSLAIGTTFTTDDSVNFDATYTSPAPIIFTVTINGSGHYFIGTTSDVTNDTSASFPSFYALLVGAPSGAILNEASWQGATFSNGVSFTPPFPNTTEVSFNGPPGIGAGDTTQLGVGFTISNSGSETFEVVLTPTVVSVPESSTWAMMLLGFAGLGFVGYRTTRKPVSIAV